MKRVISLVTVLLLCLSLAFPAYAAEFVPSIPEKGAPTIVPVLDGEGNEALGVIRDADGKIIGYAYAEDCLVVTSVSEAKKSTEIPSDAANLLLSVYDALSKGEMELPYEAAGFNAKNMVIRDLIDITWLCEDHPEMIEPTGVVLVLTFDLGVAADAEVCVMTYKNDAWNHITKVVNNGDGTVTCTFEHLCPVAFSVLSGGSTPPVQTGDEFDLMLWVVLLAVSAVGLVSVAVCRRKTNR